MLNHITLRVNDLQKSKDFFATTLEPLGYRIIFEKGASVGFGHADVAGHSDLWITAGDTFWILDAKGDKLKSFACLAFTASSKEVVDAFYQAALSAGAKDNGAPGYRPQYHPGYYAAFVLDLDGNNIEAVFDDLEKLKQ